MLSAQEMIEPKSASTSHTDCGSAAIVRLRSIAADALGQEGYKVSGNAPIYARLHDARDRAKAAGVTDIEDRPIKGAPVHTLVDLAEEVGVDLLVVGNVGLDTGAAVIGRVFSIPGAVATRAKIDVLIAHTSA